MKATTIRRKKCKRIVLPKCRKHTTGTLFLGHTSGPQGFFPWALSKSWQVRILDLNLWGSTHRPGARPLANLLTLSYLSSGPCREWDTDSCSAYFWDAGESHQERPSAVQRAGPSRLGLYNFSLWSSRIPERWHKYWGAHLKLFNMFIGVSRNLPIF